MGDPRTKDNTIERLHEQVALVMTSFLSKLDALQTASGVKDKRLTYFIDRIKSSIKIKELDLGRKLQRHEKIVAIATLRGELPEFLFNPALQLEGQHSK